MPRHRDALYIRHIREATHKIIAARFRGVTREAFDEDDDKQDGVIRQFEIVGEAESGHAPTSARHIPRLTGVVSRTCGTS